MSGGHVKGFLLAGGLGERLRPLTLAVPKCLVPIDGEPLLGYWLALCAREGVSEILLNVSQHPDQVRDYLRRWPPPPAVTLVVEARPIGSAGTVAANRAFVEREESFWVFYADNLTDVSLGAMLATHRRHDRLMTMGLFRAPVPSAAGIVELDAGGRVVAFEEKPANPRGDLANAGVYLARRGLLDRIPVRDGCVDFGHDVFPALAGEIHGHVIEQFIADIGTPAALAAASGAWARHLGKGPRR
jgi:mannose-1-phosphate guanylyltransferase